MPRRDGRRISQQPDLVWRHARLFNQIGTVDDDDRPIEQHEFEPGGAVVGDQDVRDEEVRRDVGVLGAMHPTKLRISIFRDGMVDCWGLVPFEEFKHKVRSGWVVMQPPPNATGDDMKVVAVEGRPPSYFTSPVLTSMQVSNPASDDKYK